MPLREGHKLGSFNGQYSKKTRKYITEYQECRHQLQNCRVAIKKSTKTCLHLQSTLLNP